MKRLNKATMHAQDNAAQLQRPEATATTTTARIATRPKRSGQHHAEMDGHINQTTSWKTTIHLTIDLSPHCRKHWGFFLHPKC